MLGSPAAPLPSCLQASGQCDLLRLRADLKLRRILRRLPAVTLIFSPKNPIVTNPTRGAFFAGCRTGSHGAAPSSIDHAWPSASFGNRGFSAARIALAFSIAFLALANEASATPP